MILVFLLNIGTLIIYFIDLIEAEQFPFSFPYGLIYVDKFFNAFFVFYFGLRFVAADDKLRFWLELNSLVDFFTIPPVFVSALLRRNCFGLRFLRALRLLDLPRILQILRITKDDYSIKLSKLFAMFISTWLTAAGFIHLVENNGDPWVQPVNSQPLTYFRCMYLVMVTMSTVGYGDIVVQTALGRTFIFFFIIGGLVLFANLIPEVLEIVQSRKSYKSSYEVVSGKNYIVVCGNVTLKSVTTFLQDFLFQDKGNVCTEILFLGESLPSLELEAVFECYSPYTTFFYGSALNSEDLKRVRVGISVSFALSCRCVSLVKVLKHLKDKMLLGDKDYKVMALQLSNDFADMTFIEVSVGVNVRQTIITPSYGSPCSAILINPSPQIKLHRNTMGFFIAHSLAEVKRAHFYCRVCHSDIQDPEQIERCQCGISKHLELIPTMAVFCDSDALQQRTSFYRIRLESKYLRTSTLFGKYPHSTCRCYKAKRYFKSDNPISCSIRTLFPIQSSKNQAVLYLQDHILVCVFGDANSPLIGLQDFVMPLRATNFLYHELKDIVLLGPLEYLQREWKFIQNFPKLWLFSGSALSCADLKAVNVQDCSACVILSSNTPISNNPSLVDTESILATLNVRSMEVKLSSSSLGKRASLGLVQKNPLKCLITFCRFLVVKSVCLSAVIAYSSVFPFSLFLPLQTYYNHHILALLQALVTSRTSPALEQLGEEDSKLSRVVLLLSLQEDSFGDIYCKALDMFGILCFGLYRLMEEPNPYQNRQASFILSCTVSQRMPVMTLKLGICGRQSQFLTFVLSSDILVGNEGHLRQAGEQSERGSLIISGDPVLVGAFMRFSEVHLKRDLSFLH
uniref:Potassium calcium-activated channel subfamily U member 1 n=1 Tax=Pavo cristatus TaxID=9049 RepID=A0A8C9L3L4_PAVCR